MLNWDINSLNLVQEELMKQAKKDRLAQDVIEEERKANPRYNPTLAWVGRRMLDFGGKLVAISGSEDDKHSLYSPDVHLN
ncbi:MAG: hypothetical protein ABI835_06545 [Chloroflexota bacterium]